MDALSSPVIINFSRKTNFPDQELILLARLVFFLKISSVLNQGFGYNNWLGLIC